jgi:hypothetical protein
MRVFKRVATVAMVAGLVAGAAGATSAAAATQAPKSASQVWLTGGDTSVTTAPGIAAALLGHGVQPATLRGTIWHDGGILFIDPATGKQIEVSNFIISVHQGILTAEVNGNPKVRVPLLRLSLAHATIHAGWHYVQINGIVLTLTWTAASALDATFSTTLFKAGLELGTASTVLRFR